MERERERERWRSSCARRTADSGVVRAVRAAVLADPVTRATRTARPVHLWELRVFGKGSKENKGWVDLVRQKAQFLMEVKNMSVSGGTTETMLHVLMGCEQESLSVAPEDVAVVSLSLSNEGWHEMVQTM